MTREPFIKEDYIQRLDPNGKLDFSYLDEIEPYDGDYREKIVQMNLDKEIALLEKEMNEINLNRIPFQASDFVVVFLAGLVGGVCDIVLGKPADGYNGILEKAHEPKINDDFAFGLGKYLKKYDLKNNPIDAHIPGAAVGDHRLYSYGHDLLRFFDAIRLMLNGEGIVGIRGLGGTVEYTAKDSWMTSLEKLSIDRSDPKSYLKLAIILALHLYKDYCSARSLPIPGSTLLANLNGNQMPEFVDKLTNEMEYNLRTVNGKLLSIFSIEVIIGLYSFIVKRTEMGKTYTAEQHKEKKNNLLLMSHSIALLFNTGKVAVTKNPAFINFAQIIRIVKLAWNGIKATTDRNHMAVEKTNLSVLKTQMEQLQTLVLLDESIYYTKQIDRIINSNRQQFEEKNKLRTQKLKDHNSNLAELMAQLKTFNK
nr:hypothetical protein [Paenibacillus bovis]